MENYLNNILAKIQRFTSRLDNKSVLTNKQWIVIDDDLNIKKAYIFRSNGELLVSINGDVHRAKFEVLDFGNILIEDVSNSYLYNHGFVDSEILILRKDGSNDYFTLVSNELNSLVKNQSQIYDYLNSKYLEKKEEKKQIDIKSNLSDEQKNDFLAKFEIELIDGSIIYSNKYILSKGIRLVNEKDIAIEDGKYRLKEDKSIIVENGQIVEIYYIAKYTVKDIGEIIIEQRDVNIADKDDIVFKNDCSVVEDGIYRISWCDKIYVENGIIMRRKFLGL